MFVGWPPCTNDPLTQSSWYNTARAVLFREKEQQVTDYPSFEKLMRWNDFEHDAISTQGCASGRSASNAISERGDLTSPHAGCIPGT